MTLDVALVLLNPVDASRASPWGGGGWYSFTQVQEGWQDSDRPRDQRNRWLTHTHTHARSPLLGNPTGKHHSVAALHGDSAEGHTGSRMCS